MGDAAPGIPWRVAPLSFCRSAVDSLTRVPPREIYPAWLCPLARTDPLPCEVRQPPVCTARWFNRIRRATSIARTLADKILRIREHLV
jgi:hypothetical protein